MINRMGAPVPCSSQWIFVPWLSAKAIPAPLKQQSECSGDRDLRLPASELIGADFEKQFAAVLPFEQFQKSVGKGFEPCDNILARLELARRHPACRFPGSLGIAVGVIKDQHAFHGRAMDQ